MKGKRGTGRRLIDDGREESREERERERERERESRGLMGRKWVRWGKVCNL